MLCNILFSEKTALAESCTVQSVEIPKVVSLPYSQKAQMSHVLSDKWNGAYYTKNVIIAFKILISKCRWFSACAS